MRIGKSVTITLKSLATRKKGGDNNIQKPAHDEVATVRSHVHPTMKDDATSVTSLIVVIAHPK